MGDDVVGHRIVNAEAFFPPGIIRRTVAGDAGSAGQAQAGFRRLKPAVLVGPPNLTDSMALGARLVAVENRLQRIARRNRCGAAHVDFVGRPAPAVARGGDRADDFGHFEVGRHRQQAQAGLIAGVPRHPVAVDQAFTQQLIASADADHRQAAAGGGEDGIGQAAGAQPAEVGDGVFGSRNDDGAAGGQLRRISDPAGAHPGVVPPRLAIGEVGGVRQADPGNGVAVAPILVTGGQTVLLLRLKVGSKGHRAEDGEAGGVRRKPAIGIGEKGNVAAETVNNRPQPAGSVLGREQVPGAGELRVDAAAINVANQHPTAVEVADRAQVDQVALHQVELHRTARTLH